MQRYNTQLLTTLLSFCFLFLFSDLSAQRTLRLVVTQVCVDGDNDCDPGVLGVGASSNDFYFDWGDGLGGDIDDECVGWDNDAADWCKNINIVLYSEVITQPNCWPNSLDFNWNVAECDACGCLGLDYINTAAVPDGDEDIDITVNSPIPTSGSGNYNIGGLPTLTPGGCFSGPGTYSFSARWEISGSFNYPYDNDEVCGAVDLGTINPFGTAVGSVNNSQYNNLCATATNDPNPDNWTNEQGVWFSFTTSSTASARYTIEAVSDPGGANGDDVNIQLALYEVTNPCGSPTFTEIASEHNYVPGFPDEDLVVTCLEPNTTYYILVDGLENVVDPTNAELEGWFDIRVTDEGVVQSGDTPCLAESLGQVPGMGGSVTTQFVQQSNVCATNAGDPLTIGSWGPDNTVWFSFEAPPSGSVDIYVNADNDLGGLFTNYDNIDVEIALFDLTGDPCAAYTLLFEEENYSALEPLLDIYDEQLETRCLIPGHTYYVMVDGGYNLTLLEGEQGYFDITITDMEDFPAPNDDVCNATFLPVPAVLGDVHLEANQSNWCAQDITEPDGFGFSNEQSVWYEFVAPSSGAVEIWATNIPDIISTEDAIRLELAVFELTGTYDCSFIPSNSDNFLSVVQAESEFPGDDNLLGGLFDSQNNEYMMVECLTPGQTYYLMVDGDGDSGLSQDFAEGVFNLEISGVDRDPPGINDDICDAIPLGNPDVTPIVDEGIYNNFCATATTQDSTTAFDPEHTVWFTFEAPSTGSVAIDVDNASDNDLNLQIAVFNSSDGTCTGQLSEIQSTDDNLNLDADMDQVHCLTPGDTYFLMVDGEEDGLLDLADSWDFGFFDITITEITPPPTLSLNDLVCDAVDLGNLWGAGGATGVSNTLPDENNLCATSINDPNAGFGTDFTIWYSFTTPSTPGTYAVDFYAESDWFSLIPLNLNADIVNLQLALFESDDNTCNGNMTLLQSDFDLLDGNILHLGFDEAMLVECLEPNHTYFLMVDGATLFPGDMGTGQGFFDLTATSVPTDPAAPNNDICDAANIIDLGGVPVGGSIPAGTDYWNFCADDEDNEPAPFGLDQTVWFTFDAPAHAGGPLTTSNITINLLSDPGGANADDINLQAAVYESIDGTCNFASLEEVASGDELLSYDLSLEVTCLIPGNTYYLQVDGADDLVGGVEGYFEIEIIDDGTGLFPSNDDICDAINFGTVPNGGTINDGVTYSNLCATIQESPDEPNPDAFGTDQTVWFTFTPPTSGNVTISAVGGANDIDLQLAVYFSGDGSCDADQMIEVESGWDGGGLLFYDEDLVLTCLDNSLTYYLQVDGSSAEIDGDFTITIADDGGSTTYPYNNDICNAYDFGPITSQTLTNETNVCANIEPGEPGVGTYAQHTVWYEFIAPASGMVDILVDSDLGGLTPEVHLYSSSDGTCNGTMTEIDSDTNPVTLGSIEVEINNTCVIPGQTYFIQVDGLDDDILDTDEGEFDITVSDPFPDYGTGTGGDPEPSNNECPDATVLTVQDESCNFGDGIWQLENYGQPTVSINDAFVQGCGAPTTNCGDTWYSYTMPPTGLSFLEGWDDQGLLSPDTELTMVVYQGDCNGLVPISCQHSNDSDSYLGFEVAAEPGTQIFVQIFGGNGDYFGEDFEICVSEKCGADNCLDAQVMENGVVYCWETESALGESQPTAGYGECGDQDDEPEHSVYFTFESDCNGGSITVTIFDVIYEDDPTVQPCDNLIVGNVASDGFNYTLYLDNEADPCDWQPVTMVDCEQFNGCNYAYPNTVSYTYDNLTANSTYVIQIDGGVNNILGNEVGGNVQGNIMITTQTNPEIDDMVIVDPIDCYGDDGAVTADVSGGDWPYTFEWDDGSMDSIYSPVDTGWHYVTVTADNGCEEIDSIYVPDPGIGLQFVQ